MNKKSNKQKGMDFEDKVFKTINSGALSFQKGDIHTKDYVIDAKYTDKKGFRISTLILQKLWVEALDSNKLPLLVVGIKDENIIWTITCNITKEIK